MKQQLNEVQQLQKIAGINENMNDSIQILLQWLNKVAVDKYKSIYDFKEAVNYKILSLNKK